MSHTPHPEIAVHGLQDGCPRCLEHANDPLSSLDGVILNDLWRRMVAFEMQDREEFRPRSGSEGIANAKLREYAQFLRRIGFTAMEIEEVHFA